MDVFGSVDQRMSIDQKMSHVRDKNGAEELEASKRDLLLKARRNGPGIERTGPQMIQKLNLSYNLKMKLQRSDTKWVDSYAEEQKNNPQNIVAIEQACTVFARCGGNIPLLFASSAVVQKIHTSQCREEWEASDIKDIEEFAKLAKVLVHWF